MIEELRTLCVIFRRSRTEPAAIVRRLEQEGATVVESRMVAFRHSPFSGLRVFRMEYEFRVHYRSRRGCWYVRTFDVGSSEQRGEEWAWMDADGRDDLPIVRLGAVVNNEITVNGMFEEIVTLSVAIVLGLAVVFSAYWFLR